MKRVALLLALVVLTMVSACGPIKMYVDVESKGKSEFQLPVSGRNLAVITVNESQDRDSALVSELGMGLAEKVESESGLASGSVGVYTISSDYQNIREAGSLDLLAIQSDSDLLIAIDSLEVGSFLIKRNSNAYYMNQFAHVSDVLMPLSFSVLAYDAKSMTHLYSRKVADTLSWTIMGDDEIPNSTAISQANNHLKEAMRTAGSALAQIFLPVWEEEERMITVYPGTKWESAYYLALDFKWEQAMDVWLELVKSPSLEKQGCAAYNLAVACEILGRYDTALKWLDYAETKCYFSQMTTLRKKLKER